MAEKKRKSTTPVKGEKAAKKAKTASTSKGKGFAIAGLENQNASFENFNKELCGMLVELGEIEKSKGDVVRWKSYTTAAAQLRGYPKKIESGKEAKKLKGIGVKIAAKIQQYVDTGTIPKLVKELARPEIQALKKLTSIPGVGPVAAAKWFTDLAVCDIETLRVAVSKGDIVLTSHQNVGVTYYEDLMERIPRKEVTKLAKYVFDVCKEIDPKITAQVCGSYRRGNDTSGDLDVLLMHPDFNNAAKKKKNFLNILPRIIKKLKEQEFLVADMSNGNVKYMGVCRLPDKNAKARHIDLKLFPTEAFVPALLHFTGSAEHNRQMSCIAILNGFMLNEYELRPVGENGTKGDSIPVTCEEDIFEMLGVPYREPSQRNL